MSAGQRFMWLRPIDFSHGKFDFGLSMAVAMAMAVDLDQRKAELRAEARSRRRTAAASGREAGKRAAEIFFSAVDVSGASTISGYWPIKEELDARPILEELAARGHGIGLPVIVEPGLALIFRRWSPGAPLERAGFGTMIPPKDAPEVTPALLLVPLLAFDRAGYRLGYGGGFYDRTLAQLRAPTKTLAIGLAYGAQEIPAVPRDAFDQRLDWIVTDSQAIRVA